MNVHREEGRRGESQSGRRNKEEKYTVGTRREREDLSFRKKENKGRHTITRRKKKPSLLIDSGRRIMESRLIKGTALILRHGKGEGREESTSKRIVINQVGVTETSREGKKGDLLLL